MTYTLATAFLSLMLLGPTADAYAAGRNAGGRIHEDGEFGDVGATVNAWLGGKAPGRGIPGTPILAP